MDHARGTTLANRTGMSDRKPLTSRGFTLLELLTVLAISTVLMATLVPSLAGVKTAVRRTTCGSNMRQLMLAWQMFSNEKQVLPGGANSGVDSFTRNDEYGNNVNAITQGCAYPYVREISLFKCPTAWYDYYVTYSQNWSLNSGRPINPQGTIIKKFLAIPDPANTVALLEEYDARGYIQGATVLKFPGQPEWPSSWPLQWTDSVAGNHEAGFDTTYNGASSPAVPARGDNLAFADGHVQFWVWQEWFTLLGGIGQHDSARDAPGSKDLLRLQPVFCPWLP